MKKILLTGGASLIGQSIIKTSPCDIDAPSQSVLDLSNINSLNTFDYSSYDCLILNAGTVTPYTPFVEKTSEEIKNTMDVNSTGNIILIKNFLQKYIPIGSYRATRFLKDTIKNEFVKRYGKDVDSRNNTPLQSDKLFKNHTDATIVYIGSRSIYKLGYNNLTYAVSKLVIDKVIETLQKEFKNIKFIRINPGTVNSKNTSYRTDVLSPDAIASAVWYAINNHINKLDIFED